MLVVIGGDFDEANPNHPATEAAIRHAGDASGIDVTVEWVPTTAFGSDGTSGLDGADGLFLTTGSPYRSLDGALAAITYARTRGLPFLGTCGGFQHVVVEAFRNVAGIADATHGEYDPSGPNQVIAALSCSLVGETMGIEVVEGSTAARAYATTSATERYYCQYGVADGYRDRFAEAGLTVTARDADGEARILELAGHPYFMATLFVPQASSTPDAPHPLIAAFLTAASRPS